MTCSSPAIHPGRMNSGASPAIRGPPCSAPFSPMSWETQRRTVIAAFSRWSGQCRESQVSHGYAKHSRLPGYRGNFAALQLWRQQRLHRQPGWYVFRSPYNQTYSPTSTVTAGTFTDGSSFTPRDQTIPPSPCIRTTFTPRPTNSTFRLPGRLSVRALGRK